MKVEIGLITFAFFGGMAVQDAMTPEEVVWVDYGKNPMANPQFMADMMAASAVGDEHKYIATNVGEWEVASKMWMDPKGAPMEYKGESKAKMVLGGRYLMEEFKSNIMGSPYEGLMLQGYDNLQKRYFSIWMDNMSTWPSISYGQVDEKGKFVSDGTMYDISTPAGRPMHFEVTPKGDNSNLFEMFDDKPPFGKHKSFEMLYTRKAERKKGGR